MCQLWAWCCSYLGCTDSSWLKHTINSINVHIWQAALWADLHVIHMHKKPGVAMLHCELSYSWEPAGLHQWPESHTGSEPADRPDARTTTGVLRPRTENVEEDGRIRHRWDSSHSSSCHICWCVCVCVCWDCTPVWTRGWAAWVRAAWWVAQRRHWWRWWTPGSGSPSSQKSLSSTDGPDRHPAAGRCQWHDENNGFYYKCCPGRRSSSGISPWTWKAESVGWGLLFFAEETRKRKKDGVLLEGLAGHFWATRWGKQLQTCCFQVLFRKRTQKNASQFV